MPPVGARRPDRPAYDAVIASIETALGSRRGGIVPLKLARAVKMPSHR